MAYSNYSGLQYMWGTMLLTVNYSELQCMDYSSGLWCFHPDYTCYYCGPHYFVYATLPCHTCTSVHVSSTHVMESLLEFNLTLLVMKIYLALLDFTLLFYVTLLFQVRNCLYKHRFCSMINFSLLFSSHNNFSSDFIKL